MAETVTFLELAPEFGGTRFGPFTSFEIRLGSEPSRNDITIPESLGVAPEHVKVLRQPDGSFILAPVDRSATVYYWRAGATRPQQLTAPRAVSDGDGFSLVTPEGPRFYILLENDKKRIAEQAKNSEGPALGGLGQNLNSKGILAEMKRVGLAKALTSKLGNTGMKLWTFIKTGQFLSPMYIMMGMTMLSGYLFAGGAACSWNKARGQNTNLGNDLTKCQTQLIAEGRSTTGYPLSPELISIILKDQEWGATLENDADLKAAVASSVKAVFDDRKRYMDLFKPGSGFGDFKKAVDESGLPEPVARVLTYAGAEPGYRSVRDWGHRKDSKDIDYCTRGPMKLSYAQAYHLDFRDFQVDAYFERQTTDTKMIEDELNFTAARVNAEPGRARDIPSAPAGRSARDLCYYHSGPDDRDDVGPLVRRLNEVLGLRGNNLPKQGGAFWIAARVAKLYAADLEYDTEEAFDFKSGRKRPSNVLAETAGDDEVQWVINRSGELIARALVLPCLVAMDKEMREAPPSFMGELPELGDCSLLQTYVEYDMF